jgi:hypothetical protein
VRNYYNIEIRGIHFIPVVRYRKLSNLKIPNFSRGDFIKPKCVGRPLFRSKETMRSNKKVGFIFHPSFYVPVQWDPG